MDSGSHIGRPTGARSRFLCLILALIALSGTPSFAVDGNVCRIFKTKVPNVDLRAGFPATRHQGDVGWCFAYASADVASYQLHRTGELDPNEQISPAYLALLDKAKIFNQSWNRQRINKSLGILSLSDADTSFQDFDSEIAKELLAGGSSLETLRKLFKNGVCTNSDIELPPHEQISIPLLNIYKNATKEKDSKEFKSAVDSFNLFFPKISGKDIEQVFTGIAPRMESLLELSCPKKNRISGSIFKNARHLYFKYNFENYFPRKIVTNVDELYGVEKSNFNKINQNLKRGNPIIVTHRGSMLWPRRVGLHALVIVGQRVSCKSENSVEYIVRNSYGPNNCLENQADYDLRNSEKANACREDCKKTADSMTCRKNCLTKLVEHSTNIPFSCEDGYYFVEATHLLSSIKALTVIDPFQY